MSLPMITARYREGMAHIQIIGQHGPLADYHGPAEGSAALDGLGDEIAPWLETLGHLEEVRAARAAHHTVQRALDAWYAEEHHDPYLHGELAEVVARYQTDADVDAARRELAAAYRDEPVPAHLIAHALLGRLARQAAEAHQRAQAAAPGPVPELLLWEAGPHLRMTWPPQELAACLQDYLDN